MSHAFAAAAFPDEIRGTFCTLIPPHADQVREHLAYLSDVRTMEHLWFLNDGASWSEETVRSRIQRFVDENQSGEARIYSIVDVQSGRIAGQCGFKGLDRRNSRAEFGIILGHEHWGTGLAAECMLLCLERFFGDLGYARVLFTTTATNDRALKLLGSLDCVREGVLRASLAKGEERIDELIFATLSNEWPRTQSRLVERVEKALQSDARRIEMAASSREDSSQLGTDIKKWPVKKVWEVLSSLDVGSWVLLASMLGALFSAGLATGAVTRSPAAALPCSEVAGIYFEGDDEGFPASSICAAPGATTLVVACDASGKVSLAEISYNSIFSTNRAGGGVGEEQLACGGAASDRQLCLYSAEWHFAGDFTDGTTSGIMGKVARRVQLDECGSSLSLEPAKRQALDDLKQHIRNSYTTASCDLSPIREGKAISGVRKTCVFDGRKADAHAGIFRRAS